MIVKGPISIKWKQYVFVIKDISIDPADRSVGIMDDTVADFDIAEVRYSNGKRLRPADAKDIANWLYRVFGMDMKSAMVVEKKMFNELYKLEKKAAEIAWKKYKAKGGKFSKREFMSEYT